MPHSNGLPAPPRRQAGTVTAMSDTKPDVTILPSYGGRILSILHKPTNRELFSPIMLRIGAFGPETQPYGLPSFLGYRIRPGDSLLVTAMLHNPTPRDYRGVRLRVRLQLTPAASWLRAAAAE